MLKFEILAEIQTTKTREYLSWYLNFFAIYIVTLTRQEEF